MPGIEDTVCSWCANRPLTLTDLLGILFNFVRFIHYDVKFVGKTASWIVIFASVNICFPDLLRRIRDGKSLRGYIIKFLTYLYPLVMHSVFWTQYVHLWTYCLARLGLSPQLVTEWTAFFAGVSSVIYLYVSLWLTGIVEGHPFPWTANGQFTQAGGGSVCSRLRFGTGLQLECRSVTIQEDCDCLEDKLEDQKKREEEKQERRRSECITQQFIGGFSSDEEDETLASAQTRNITDRRRSVRIEQRCSRNDSSDESDRDYDSVLPRPKRRRPASKSPKRCGTQSPKSPKRGVCTAPTSPKRAGLRTHINVPPHLNTR